MLHKRHCLKIGLYRFVHAYSHTFIYLPHHVILVPILCKYLFSCNRLAVSDGVVGKLQLDFVASLRSLISLKQAAHICNRHIVLLLICLNFGTYRWKSGRIWHQKILVRIWPPVIFLRTFVFWWLYIKDENKEKRGRELTAIIKSHHWMSLNAWRRNQGPRIYFTK